MKKRSLIFTILAIGFSGLVAQILLLREFLIVFLGNELSIGIILSNWLILEALGSFFGGKVIDRSKRKIEILCLLLLIFSLSLPFSVYLIRILKSLLGLAAGEAMGLEMMFISSLLLLLLTSISHGALFTASCKIYSQISGFKGKAPAIGKVYIFETLGTVLGGVVLTYILIPFFDSFKIALGLSLIISIFAVLVVINFWSRGFSQKLIGGLALLFGAVFLFALVFLSDGLHKESVKRQWPGQEVLFYNNSIYGNVAVAKKEEQLTFFSNGLSRFSSPTPDIARVEEFAHLPLLSHPKPEDVLILSGGIGGLLNEVLKHPSLERIDYAELDPLLLRVARSFPTSLTEKELNDPRVFKKLADPRFFVKNTTHRYDLIFVGAKTPLDLQVNRLFTQEFFIQAKAKLKSKGIMVLSLPGSLTYLSQELKNLNFSIILSLKQAFDHVKVIPGDSANIFMASDSDDILAIRPALLFRRFKERDIDCRLISQGHLDYKLDLNRAVWFRNALRGARSGINQDFRPLGLFYALSYFSSSFSPKIKDVFVKLESIDLKVLLGIISLAAAFMFFLSFRLKRPFKSAIVFSLTTSGLLGMIFDLAIIFSFQVIFGYVFYWIGMLVAVFMLGVVAGGLATTLRLDKIKYDFGTFLSLEISLAVFSLLLPLVIIFLKPYLESTEALLLARVGFLLLGFMAGFLTAAQFPLANKMYLKQGSNPQVGQTAGLLYSADLVGGWIGGILGAVFLLPVLGLANTFIVLSLIKLSSIVFLILSRKKAVSL